MHITIDKWAEADRPREKMMRLGAAALSDAELLAILIGSGTVEQTAVALMQEVCASSGNSLSALGKWNLNDFLAFKGLGEAKSLKIMAALELGKRRSRERPPERARVVCSRDIYELFHASLCDQPVEEFWLLLLNQAAKVIDRVRISRGGIDQTAVDVRLILREALLHNATQIAVVHNHPSGNTRPSNNDKQLTQDIRKAAEVMHIHLLDHVIVTDGAYFSFNDEGLL